MSERHPCPDCGGTGWRIERHGEREVAVRCGCRGVRTPEAALRAARVPARYQHCAIEGFELWNAGDPSLRQARDRVREWVDCYPAVDRGLLLMGRAGTGKTHLAIAALRELILAKGVRGMYVDFLDLVQQLQASFDVPGGRHDVLRPVVNADVLVLDELGSGKTGQWVLDLVYYIVNSRYLDKRLTICTTNFRDLPERGAAGAEEEFHPRLAEKETLADRVGTRVRSRLFEMCDVVELRGEDYRQDVIGRRWPR